MSIFENVNESKLGSRRVLRVTSNLHSELKGETQMLLDNLSRRDDSEEIFES